MLTPGLITNLKHPDLHCETRPNSTEISCSHQYAHPRHAHLGVKIYVFGILFVVPCVSGFVEQYDEMIML
ncbi:hypothetical protein C0J52_19230 [Blattella germanica]|nr:hypothetical protein C0J52_19230 [Blattella germanica]